MTQIPTLAQLIKEAIESKLLDVQTALIAKVGLKDDNLDYINI